MDLTSIILLVAGFSLIILVHEAGHFLAAKYVGIKCEQFALGFGQAIFSWRRGLGFRLGSSEKEYQRLLKPETEGVNPVDPSQLGETEYRFNWIPLGGYVKMMGQDDTKPGLVVQDPRSYTSKTVSQRMLVISAGVIMNIIFALIAFIVLFFTGLQVPQAVVGDVAAMSPAQFAVRADGTPAPLQVGDQILKVNGRDQHNDFRKIALNTALSSAGEALKVEVKRVDGTVEELRITPIKARQGQIEILSIGVGVPRTLEGFKPNKLLMEEWKNLPAEQRVVAPGEYISHVNGQPVGKTEFHKLDQAVQKSEGQPVEITVVQQDGGTRTEKVNVQVNGPFGDRPLAFAGMLPRATVHGIAEQSSAHGKLKDGDVIVAIDVAGDVQRDPSAEEFRKRVSRAGAAGSKLTLTVLRDGKEVSIPDLEPNRRIDTAGGRGLGVGVGVETDTPVVAATLPNSPAAAVLPGSLIKAVNGIEVKNWDNVLRELRKAQAGQPVNMTVVQPAGASTDLALQLAKDDVEFLHRLRYSAQVVLKDLTDSRTTTNPVVAAWWGIEETRDSILQVYLTLRRLTEGSVPLNGIVGPVGMVQMGTKVASQGMDYLLWFLAIISANLAVVNFLPIPVVDGGHFLFLIIEKIQGKPVSERAMVAAQWVGLALIGTVFIAVTYQDILRLLIVQ